MDKRLDRLITKVRRATENEDVDVSNGIGIDTEEFVDYANDAQDRLQSLILNEHPNNFIEESTQTTSADTEAYSLPDNTYLGSKIHHIEIADNPTATRPDYIKLDRGFYEDRNTSDTCMPEKYIVKNSKVLLAPTPDTSYGLRINTVRSVYRIDIRRGSVASATITAGALTALTLNTADLNSNINDFDYLCLVDKDGNFKIKNIPVDSVNTGTGVVTINGGSHTLESGETTAAGDYVCGEKYTTTHSEFPNMVERYIRSYMERRIQYRDSSDDVIIINAELQALEQDIVDAYAEKNDDIIRINESNDDWDH